jgi:hypothetical protein
VRKRDEEYRYALVDGTKTSTRCFFHIHTYSNLVYCCGVLFFPLCYFRGCARAARANNFQHVPNGNHKVPLHTHQHYCPTSSEAHHHNLFVMYELLPWVHDEFDDVVVDDDNSHLSPIQITFHILRRMCAIFHQYPAGDFKVPNCTYGKP